MAIITKELRPTEMPATVAAPVDTYVRPAPSRVDEFLSGLRSLGGTLETTVQSFNKDAGEQEEADARMKALRADPAELRKEVASGNYYGMAHKRAQTALGVMDAQNRAFEVSSDLAGMAERGELQGDDAHARVAALVGAKSQELKDPLAVKQFLAGVEPVMHKSALAILHNNIKADQDNKESQLYSYVTGLHDQVDRDAAEGGQDEAGRTAAHKKAMYLTADFAKNNLMLSPQQLEGVMGKAAEHYANQGNVAALSALGGYDRGGAPLKERFGPKWDALEKHAKTVQDGEQKKVTAGSVDGLDAEALRGEGTPEDFRQRVDAARAKDPENFTESRAERLKLQYERVVATRAHEAAKLLAQQQEQLTEREFVEKGAQAVMSGDAYSMPESVRFRKADGNEKTFKYSDYAPQMYERASAMLEERGVKEGWDQQKLQTAKLHLYGQNGDVHPTLQKSFNAMFMASSAGATTSPEKLQTQLAQLEFVRENDRSQFLNLSAKQSKQPGKLNSQELWLHTYSAARDYGADPETAYAKANQRVFTPGAMDRVPVKKLDEHTDAVLKKLGLSGPLARMAVHDAVQLQAGAGVTEADLAKKAQELIAQSKVVAGGTIASNFLPGVGDMNVAGEYLTDAARFFKESSANLKAQPFEIAFADDPARTGHYIAIRTDTMERVSRSGVSGEQLKDFVLQWRQHYHEAGEPPGTKGSGFKAVRKVLKTEIPK